MRVSMLGLLIEFATRFCSHGLGIITGSQNKLHFGLRIDSLIRQEKLQTEASSFTPSNKIFLKYQFLDHLMFNPT